MAINNGIKNPMNIAYLAGALQRFLPFGAEVLSPGSGSHVGGIGSWSGLCGSHAGLLPQAGVVMEGCGSLAGGVLHLGLVFYWLGYISSSLDWQCSA